MTESEGSDKEALDLFRMLKRHLDGGISIRKLAEETGVSERTLYRDISSFRRNGIKGLRRNPRADRGKRRKVTDEVQKAIEGLCLKTPQPPVMWVCRQIAKRCREKDLPIPCYTVVLDIYHRLDQRLKTLAHKGDKAYEQEYDPLLRREAESPNDTWQCDHKDLKLWAVDHNGRKGKVWITAILDDFSRMIPGYFMAIGAPNSMRIATALRQAVWTKSDERWPVSGIPDVFYSDHGSDFTSTHIEQVGGDLGMELVNTIVFKPRGRGKIERFFRTLVQMFCPDHDTSPEKPKSLAEIETDFREWLDGYHHRNHKEIKMTPIAKWSAAEFLPRLPDSLDALDLMLMKVSKPRTMKGDGLRFDNKRYGDELLSESIGEEFDIRYDPRDLSHIWVYGKEGNLVCKARCLGLHPTAEQTEEVISSRQRVKKRLKRDLKDKQAVGEKFIAKPDSDKTVSNTASDKPAPHRRLRRHYHERE